MNTNNNFKKKIWYLKLAMQGNAVYNQRQLERWQWLNQEQTLALQQERLKNLLSFANRHVPYYRNVFKKNGLSEKNCDIDLINFNRIPLLEKPTLRSSFDALKSDDLHKRKWRFTTSGGSTGEPVRIIQDKEYLDWGQAIKNLDDEWSGYSIGTKQILLWGSEQDLFVGRETIKTRLRRWLRNELCLNAFLMTPEQMMHYVEQINACKPVRIFAYSNSIYELARFIEDKGLKAYSPKTIKTTASNLLKHMRETIERVFDAPVYDCYGSREVGDIACECNHHKGLHIIAPNIYIEILGPDGNPVSNGKAGEIVVTSLTNYAMPLIRYRIGDMGKYSEKPCSCGRGFPLLKEVSGRVTDVFVKEDGGVVLPEYLIHLVGVVLNNGWIKKYQIIQEDFNDIRIIIVPDKPDADHKTYEQEEKAIAEKVRLVMGNDCKIQFHMVKDIEPTSTGKYRYTISKVRRESLTH